jgi:hypothetical protein
MLKALSILFLFLFGGCLGTLVSKDKDLESLRVTMDEVSKSRAQASLLVADRDNTCNGCVATILTVWPINYYHVSYVGDLPNQSIYSIHVVGEIVTYPAVNDCAIDSVPCTHAISTSTSSFSYLCTETLISGPPLSPGVATDAAGLGVKSTLDIGLGSVVTPIQLGTYVDVNKLTGTLSCGETHRYRVGVGDQSRIGRTRTTECN